MPDTPVTARVEISGDGPLVTSFKIGGHTVLASRAVLTLDAQDVPELAVSLPIVDGVAIALDARTGVDEETRAGLIAMGWTPPDHGEREPGGES